MKTLDKYIVRSFLFNALLFFIVMMALRIVGDLFAHMDEFAEQQNFSGMITSIFTYYAYQSLVYFTELGGVIIVASAAFTVARMNHTNELTAMMASGVSLYRVVWPIVLCSMLLGGLIIIDQEFVIPQVPDKLVRSPDDAHGMESFKIRLTPDSAGAVWYSDSFTPANEKMEQPVILIRDPNYTLQAGISAGLAKPGKLFGSRGWLLEDARMSFAAESGQAWPHMPDVNRIFSNIGPEMIMEKTEQGPTGNLAIRDIWAKDNQYNMVVEAKRFIPDPYVEGEFRSGTLEQPRFTFRGDNDKILGVFFAKEALWQGGEIDESFWKLVEGRLFFTSDLTTEVLTLRRDSDWLHYMSSGDLGNLLKLRKVSDEETARLTKHIRVTDPINNLLMLLLGLPFILSRERNIKASASLCLLTVGAFYCFIYLCRYIGLDPFWAACLPTLLFGSIAVVMLDSIKT